MSKVLTLEGYYSEGSFHAYESMPDIPAGRRVLITILDEITPRKRGTWEEFDKLVDEIHDKPKLEDFPRCDLCRPLVDFTEANV